MEPEPEPEPVPAVSALAERFGAAGMAGLGCDERAAALSWYAPESQRRDGGAQSARQEQARAAAQATALPPYVPPKEFGLESCASACSAVVSTAEIG